MFSFHGCLFVIKAGVVCGQAVIMRSPHFTQTHQNRCDLGSRNESDRFFCIPHSFPRLAQDARKLEESYAIGFYGIRNLKLGAGWSCRMSMWRSFGGKESVDFL